VRSAGASGIAFGLIGFGIAYTQRTAGPSHPMRDLYMKWALYGFIFSILVPGIDVAGHAGGFIGGLVFGFVLPTAPSIKERLKGLWIPLGVLCLIIWGYTLYSMVHFMRVTAGLNLTEIDRMLNRMR
jgi:rhomboid protease GluP